jgi:hypothetical protein
MREELAANTVLPTKASFGLDIPAYSEGDAWWVPQGIAARFRSSGVELALQAPGPYWLSKAPSGLLGRAVTTLSAQEVLGLTGLPEMFWKFAEAKVDIFQASVLPLSEVQEFLKSKQIPATAVLQYSTPLALGNEYRLFIRDGQVCTASVYLTRKHGVELTYYDYANSDEQELARVVDFANKALPQLQGPGGYVLDVALTQAGEAVVLEANPAWCSAWYGCDINEVVRTVVAAHEKDERWSWQPDPYLTNRYSKMLPLKRAS